MKAGILFLLLPILFTSCMKLTSRRPAAQAAGSIDNAFSENGQLKGSPFQYQKVILSAVGKGASSAKGVVDVPSTVSQGMTFNLIVTYPCASTLAGLSFKTPDTNPQKLVELAITAQVTSDSLDPNVLKQYLESKACIVGAADSSGEMTISESGTAAEVQNYLNALNANQDWEALSQDIPRDTKIKIAVLDTGVDRSNAIFSPGTFLDSTINFLTSAGLPSIADLNGHGTSMAYIIGGKKYLDGRKGISAHVEIIPIRAFDDTGKGTSVDFVNALYLAKNLGAKIALYAGGGYSNGCDMAMTHAIYAVRDQVLVVNSAGNGVSDLPTAPKIGIRLKPLLINEMINVEKTHSPSCAGLALNNLIVAANLPTGTKTLDVSSNFGRPVQVAAPGSRTPTMGIGATPTSSGGTSSAAANVAGATAEILAYIEGKKVSVTPGDLKLALLYGAEKVNSLMTPILLTDGGRSLNLSSLANYVRGYLQTHKDFSSQPNLNVNEGTGWNPVDEFTEIKEVQVAVRNSLVVGEQTQAKVYIVMRDNTVKENTFPTFWSISNSTLLQVSNTGSVRALSALEDVSKSYSAITVRVRMPTKDWVARPQNITILQSGTSASRRLMGITLSANYNKLFTDQLILVDATGSYQDIITGIESKESITARVTWGSSDADIGLPIFPGSFRLINQDPAKKYTIKASLEGIEGSLDLNLPRIPAELSVQSPLISGNNPEVTVDQALVFEARLNAVVNGYNVSRATQGKWKLDGAVVESQASTFRIAGDTLSVGPHKVEFEGSYSGNGSVEVKTKAMTFQVSQQIKSLGLVIAEPTIEVGQKTSVTLRIEYPNNSVIAKESDFTLTLCNTTLFKFENGNLWALDGSGGMECVLSATYRGRTAQNKVVVKRPALNSTELVSIEFEKTTPFPQRYYVLCYDYKNFSFFFPKLYAVYKDGRREEITSTATILGYPENRLKAISDCMKNSAGTIFTLRAAFTGGNPKVTKTAEHAIELLNSDWPGVETDNGQGLQTSYMKGVKTFVTANLVDPTIYLDGVQQTLKAPAVSTYFTPDIYAEIDTAGLSVGEHKLRVKGRWLGQSNPSVDKEYAFTVNEIKPDLEIRQYNSAALVGGTKFNQGTLRLKVLYNISGAINEEFPSDEVFTWQLTRTNGEALPNAYIKKLLPGNTCEVNCLDVYTQNLPPRTAFILKVTSKKHSKSAQISLEVGGFVTLPYNEQVLPPTVGTSPVAVHNAALTKCTDIDFVRGNGTKESPYEICSPEQLLKIPSKVVETYYKLTADIDLSTTEVADRGHFGLEAFDVHLDGNGYQIQNLTIDSDQDYIGLFSKLSGEIKNLGLVQPNIRGQNYVGVLAGEFSGTIDNSYIAKGQVSGNNFVGGFVGNVSAAKMPRNSMNLIKNSFNQGTKVVALGYNVGGIVGMGYPMSLLNISSDTIVESTGFGTNRYQIGLVAGFLNGYYYEANPYFQVPAHPASNAVTKDYMFSVGGDLPLSMSSSHMAKQILAKGTLRVLNSGPANNFIGGVFGSTSDMALLNVRFEGKIDSVGNHVGGIVGLARSAYVNHPASLIAKASAVVELIGRTNIGGIAGLLEGITIQDSRVEGSVKGMNVAGGMFGILSGYNSVIRTVSTANVSVSNLPSTFGGAAASLAFWDDRMPVNPYPPISSSNIIIQTKFADATWGNKDIESSVHAIGSTGPSPLFSQDPSGISRQDP